MGRNVENVLEERDPQYDAMLSQMVGRIKAKPGGKPEMGEVSEVYKFRIEFPCIELGMVVVEVTLRYRDLGLGFFPSKVKFGALFL